MNNQTAMRQLLNQLREERNTLPMDAEWNRCFQAIEMIIQTKFLPLEKEQIMKAARQCHFEGLRQTGKNSEEYIKYGNDYYNETYNK
jgi:hypothetical protein